MGARQTVIAAALVLAGVLVSPASAVAAQDEPSNLSWLLGRTSTADLANWYADGMPAVVGATAIVGPLSSKCPPPTTVGCGIAAGAPLAVWSYESAVFARAKRNNACIIVWDSRDNPIPISASGGLNYAAIEYSGAQCQDGGDRPITFDEYAAMRTE